MEDTCRKEKCLLWDTFDGNCPNMVESFWEKPMSGEKKLITDCAPKRTMLMIQELYNRLTGIQKAMEGVRNENAWVQVVAEVLGRNSGIDLTSFVEERQRRLRIEDLKQKKLPKPKEKDE